MPVKNTINLDGNVVLCHDKLRRNVDNLNFDIHSGNGFGYWIDFDKTRIDTFIELAESRYETYAALLYGFIGIRAAYAAWNLVEMCKYGKIA